MLLHFIWSLIAFIFALGILITVHEFGHFLAARFFKVKVERFSIGFGPVLWKWRDSTDTEYVISAIFFGGYVKLYHTQDTTTFCNREKNNTFDYKRIWEKSIIVISGPIFNFIFSILSYTIVFMIGVPNYKPIIYSVAPNSIIDKSNIPSGVEIKLINSVKVYNWEEVRLEIFNNIDKKEITIATAPINSTCIDKTYIINLSKNWFDISNVKDPIVALGIIPFDTQIIPVISNIKSNSAAQRFGLKVGDKILSINEQPIHNWESFILFIKNNLEKKFQITVERKNKILNLGLTLNKKNLVHFNQVEEYIGVIPKIITIPSKHYVINQYGLFESIQKSCEKTWRLICLTTNTLFKLIAGKINITNLGGPISIAQGAGQSARSGIIYYLMFLSLISINLGIINLLPFPALDGGHLLFFIIEKIKGKSISKTIQNFCYIIGSTLLIVIMCLAIFNDISRFW